MKRLYLFLLPFLFFAFSQQVSAQSKLFKYKLERAKRGDVNAQFDIGICYRSGIGCKRSSSNAIKWLTSAAEQGHIKAQFSLAHIYDQKNDWTKAIKWYTLAAEQGDEISLNSLGSIYTCVAGAPHDYVKAAECYLKGAKRGYASSQYSIGRCYELGQGVQQDYTKATEWYLKAAEQGNKYAEERLTENSALAQIAAQIKTNPTTPSNPKASPAAPVAPKLLPVIGIVANSIAFVDATGNKAIDANEKCTIKFQVSNTGKGAGKNCVAKVTTSAAGVNVMSKNLPEIAPGQTINVEIPVTASMATTDGKANFSILIEEPNGFGSETALLAVETRAFATPLVKVADYAIAGTPDGKIKKRAAFDLQLLVQNVKHGKAEDVSIDISVPKDVFVTTESTRTQVGTLDGGAQKQVKYEMMVSNNYAAASIPVTINLREKHGKFAESRTLQLPIGEKISSITHVDIDAKSEEQQGDIQLASIAGKTQVADIDINIPTAATTSSKTFAVIIGNEDYQRVSKVDHALNDARVFAEYCQKALGLPASNVRTYQNATFGGMMTALEDIKAIAEAYEGDLNVIFYYAGHGIPDESSRSAFLLPVDIDGSQTRLCLSVDKLYGELASLNARRVMVIMDACFSGSQRGEGMLAAARGVAIKAKTGAPQGNMIVLTAATGDQTAYPYKEKGHGLFTYYLLKKLQDSKGTATLGELCDFVSTQVKRQSVVINRNAQTPTFTAAPALGDTWRTWQLR